MLSEIEAVLRGESRHAVIEGDCQQVPWPVVDHVITDPPYEAAAHTLQRRVARDVAPRDAPPKSEIDSRGRKMEVEPLSFAPISEELRGWAGLEMARVAKRWIVAFCQVEAAVKWSEALAAGGATTKRIGVWVKPDGMPQFSGDRPGMGYESMVFAHRKGRSRWNGGGRVGVFTHNKGGEQVGHETTKPVPLMLELVELFTDPGELILDPFCGSGTTGVACLRLGRRFIGIERDPKYAAIARERLAAESRGLSLKSARAGQGSIFDVLGQP